jgi:hypothetical protein
MIVHDAIKDLLDAEELNPSTSCALSEQLTPLMKRVVVHFLWLSKQSDHDKLYIDRLHQHRLFTLAKAKEVGGPKLAVFFSDFLDQALELAQATWSLGEDAYDSRWFGCLRETADILREYDEFLDASRPFYVRWCRRLFMWHDPFYVSDERIREMFRDGE